LVGEENRLRQGLGDAFQGLPFTLLSSTDSTNLRLKEGAREGRFAPPYLLIADAQTRGRGRLGRSFLSPPGTGLYMSLLLRPAPPWNPGQITILAAVAACRAIEEETGLHPAIKWVNDLFLRGKKICGILAEAMGDQVIVGIGINLQTPPGGFPDDLAIAGALDCGADRLRLAGRIAAHLLRGMERLNDPAIVDAYRRRMPLIGRDITYTRDGQQKNARVTGVSEDGGLIIRDATGEKILRTGEVTLGSHSFLGME